MVTSISIVDFVSHDNMVNAFLIFVVSSNFTEANNIAIEHRRELSILMKNPSKGSLQFSKYHKTTQYLDSNPCPLIL
jgi:hypothetical protein